METHHPDTVPSGGPTSPIDASSPATAESLPAVPLAQRLTRPFIQFAENKVASGVLLVAAAVLALLWANSPWAALYYQLWEIPVTIGAPAFGLTKTLLHWINDGLMAVFFLMVGLEIKREILVGELASVRQATLPIVGAIGGMVVPAVIYAMFAMGTPAASGWGIPMATDIAFALGVLALLGDRVPVALKIFLAALAIVDDIGAVLVIAFFYTGGVHLASVGIAALIFVLLLGMNRAGFKHPMPYAIVGLALWLAVYHSGVHATIAGVLLAAVIPASTRIDGADFLDDSQRVLKEFEDAGGDVEDVMTNQSLQDAVYELEHTARAAQSPLLRLERQLHGVVSFFIMPLFAFANAGVSFSADTLNTTTEPVVLGIVFGLLLGKPLGIGGAAWLAMRFRLAEMPVNTNWALLGGVCVLGGIGFTMSLFISGLAFGDPALLDEAKVGILAGSLFAGTVGALLIARGARRARARDRLGDLIG